MTRLTVETPVGPAEVELEVKRNASKLLVIGHGAGGSIDAVDLVAVQQACLAAGISVARVTQPYRLAGRRLPPAAANLDSAWAAVLAALGRRKALASLGFVYAGRSSGARVACRAAVDDQVEPRPIGVVALAFPVHPPGKPEKSRLAELDSVTVPVLVVQGTSDPFGMPGPAAGRQVRQVAGNHSLKASAAEVGELVASWISAL
ncbi:MAG: alpha/beta hydrolase [Actinomycetota bacterium]|nr:alpha/beta hydrolase [Actinomycetota bacterium]MDQ2958379.1 alpha/beta hydrolase [Actinomycetota bacterium]